MTVFFASTCHRYLSSIIRNSNVTIACPNILSKSPQLHLSFDTIAYTAGTPSLNITWNKSITSIAKLQHVCWNEKVFKRI